MDLKAGLYNTGGENKNIKGGGCPEGAAFCSNNLSYCCNIYLKWGNKKLIRLFI
jgi:hypothetical protein